MGIDREKALAEMPRRYDVLVQHSTGYSTVRHSKLAGLGRVTVLADKGADRGVDAIRDVPTDPPERFDRKAYAALRHGSTPQPPRHPANARENNTWVCLLYWRAGARRYSATICLLCIVSERTARPPAS